jgi:hypothetical protein
MAAGTVTVSCAISIIKDGATVAGSGNLNLTMAGTELIGNNQIIGTTNETIVLGDVTTVGYVFIKNNDPTNFVTISVDSSQAQVIAKLLPGEFTLFKPNTSTINSKADTGACSCFVAACEL